MYEDASGQVARAPRPSRRRRHVPGLFRAKRQRVQAVRVLPDGAPDPCRAGDLQTLVGWPPWSFTALGAFVAVRLVCRWRVPLPPSPQSGPSRPSGQGRRRGGSSPSRRLSFKEPWMALTEGDEVFLGATAAHKATHVDVGPTLGAGFRCSGDGRECVNHEERITQAVGLVKRNREGNEDF